MDAKEGTLVSYSILTRMTRPCYLVVDREYSSNISTRKLVIETAKLNVITAYSGAEAVETLKRFPNIDGIVIDEDVRDIPFKDLIAQFKNVQPTPPVILIRSPMADGSHLADYELESFKPAELLQLLEKLQPEAAKAIEKTNERLAEEH
jgi:CheY-like chemotaxis protein